MRDCLFPQRGKEGMEKRLEDVLQTVRDHIIRHFSNTCSNATASGAVSADNAESGQQGSL
jgi:hypothetical protein